MIEFDSLLPQQHCKLVLRLFQLFRLIQLASRISIVLGRTGNRMIYTTVFSVMAVSLGAVGICLIEHSVEGTKITNLGDAFWWAIPTVTTVGYADVSPITAEGKVIAALLMIVGIAILGILISTLGAGLIESRLFHYQCKILKIVLKI